MVASSTDVLNTVIAAGFDINKPDQVGKHLKIYDAICKICVYIIIQGVHKTTQRF